MTIKAQIDLTPKEILAAMAENLMTETREDLASGRCSCGAPEPCLAPRFGGQHVPREVWR